MKETIWVWRVPTEGNPIKINSEVSKLISWTCKAARGSFSLFRNLEGLVLGPVETQGLSGLINIYIIKVHQLERQGQFYLVLHYCEIIFVNITVCVCVWERERDLVSLRSFCCLFGILAPSPSRYQRVDKISLAFKLDFLFIHITIFKPHFSSPGKEHCK